VSSSSSSFCWFIVFHVKNFWQSLYKGFLLLLSFYIYIYIYIIFHVKNGVGISFVGKQQYQFLKN